MPILKAEILRFLTGTPISIQAYLGNPGLTGVWSKDTAGPISRTVEDSAITLGAIAGYDPKDPYTLDIPVPDYRSALDGDIKGVRVGVISEHINSPLVEPQVRDAVVKATNVLGELGAVVEEVSLPLVTHSAAFFTPIALAETALIHSRWTRERLQDYGHNNRIGLLTGNLIPAQAYYKAQKLRVLLRRQLLQALASYDVLALPTAGRAAQRISDDAVITSKRMAERIPFVFTRIFNQAGTPSISVPCGFTSQGLPIGLQLGGRPFEERALLKVAHAYEQSTSWHTMRPPFA